ncbi:hypothetical protein ACWCZ5_15065 [Streptomyces sp. NPDC001667]
MSDDEMSVLEGWLAELCSDVASLWDEVRALVDAIAEPSSELRR